jgi:hypothetical protein
VPCKQSSSCICHIGNHCNSSKMMPHKNFKHWGRLYIVLLFFVAFSYVFVLCWCRNYVTYLLFMVSTLLLGVSWQDCVELRSYHSFSLIMACVERIMLALHGENQGSKNEVCSI